MNWLDVSYWCKAHTCFEHQRTGRCCCPGTKTCGKGRECAILAELLADGAEDPASVRKIRSFVRSKSCGVSRSGKECNHRGCIKAEEIVCWLEQQAAPVAA